ncbi:MAG: toprim domain-containing protein [Patescibacteria group bacterium]
MNIIQQLAESFRKFPGIGPRQARRFVDYLIKEGEQEIKNLSDEISELKKTVRQCRECGYHFVADDEGKQCKICRNPNRDSSLLLVVEKDIDLENIEKSGAYKGVYYVLGATINDFNKNKTEAKKQFENLFNLIKQSAGRRTEKIKEAILATSVTGEGEATAVYLERILEPLKNSGLKISRLGRGLSTGTELEYSDADTIKNSLENRK